MPTGWCTRYGPVDELVAKRDDALVLINSGDELTLAFSATSCPSNRRICARLLLFIRSVGKKTPTSMWKRFSGGPLPFHGMDDQLYGRQPRPVIEGDWWIKKYNTRWVGPVYAESNNQVMVCCGPALSKAGEINHLVAI